MTTFDDPLDERAALDGMAAPTPLDGDSVSLPSPRDSGRGGVGAVTQDRIGALVFERLFEQKPEVLRIGRFSVLERIGRGGMGTVYAAYDEQLDRKIAIKVIGSADFADDVARRRLEREAQAMARLTHTNVVTVYEVGNTDGEVFVAMEFIRGKSLAEWINDEPDWREVLDAFVQAGRGLVAAHQAGLVHRDLKPHNIMRTDDGVVKVLDFGLARAAGDEASDELDEALVRSDSGGSALAVDLTRTGAVLGTPAYMAPEQHRGELADARSDQFSFCVALYEALHRRRPFDARTPVAIAHRMVSGDVEPPPTDGRVPSWVHRIVLRGLSPKPSDRWPSMLALVQALERDPTRSRRRWMMALGLGILAGLGGFGLAELRADEAASCPPADAERQALWPDARRERIGAAFEASDSLLAADTLVRVSGRVDDYVGQLGDMRHEVCESHRGGMQSLRLFDLRTACLDARRAGLDELLTELEHADAATVQNATWAVASLPGVAPCGDTGALTAAVAPPEDAEVAAQVQRERETLASTASLVLAGAYEAARERALASLQRAQTLAYEPLVAEAELGLGAALMGVYQHEAAREALTRSIAAALRSGHDEVAVEALARRMWVVADPLRQPSQGRRDDEVADALAHKLGRPTRLQWLLLNNRGVALFRSGALVEAERSYREALAVIEQADPDAYPVEQISTRFNLAMLLSTGLGRPSDAADELRSGRVAAEALLGPEHPHVAIFTARLAANLVEAGRPSAAQVELDEGLGRLPPSDVHPRATFLLERANLHATVRRNEAALADAQAALMLIEAELPDDPMRAVGLSLRGFARVGLAGGLQEVERGLEDLRDAVAREQQRVGPDNELVANARWWLGRALHRAGRLDEASGELERAWTIYEGLGAGGGSTVGRQSVPLIEVYLARGELARAEEVVRATYRVQDDAGYGPDNIHRLQVLRLEGELRAVQGRAEQARAAFERACTGLAAIMDGTEPELAACRLGHARVLGSTSQARSLAEQARAAYRDLGSGFEEQRAAAEALLASLAAPSP
ncbi:serine/threonine-protein kinase [Paraliomyxa miuraensis]|uniref:serine/threonine-protein kinase n=1 Tax=Paraliomyxa miuraensis TaxID=376150 RepID=UPI00224CCE81|nr:serine/threonine-protein kinase [Paraliomyxa miuraensis]MCX4241424.1 serine/threonine protein kinase [Paraliomyxa miuraensis]